MGSNNSDRIVVSEAQSGMKKPRQRPSAPAGFVRRLEQCMAEQDIAARPLAEKAGLGQTAVRDIFKLQSDPTLNTFLKLAAALNVSPGWLLAGEGDKLGPAQPVGEDEQAALSAIGARLAAARSSMRLTVAAFSKLIGMPDYEEYEIGLRPISLFQLMQICSKSGLSMDYVVFGDASAVSDELAAVLSSPGGPHETSESRGGARHGSGLTPGSGSTQKRTRSSI